MYDCNNQCRHALNPSAKIRRIIYTAKQKNTAIFQLRKFKTNFARTGCASGDIPIFRLPQLRIPIYIIPSFNYGCGQSLF